MGYAFKAYIVDTKNYEIGSKIYNQMYEEFIERYFGENKAIKEYAKKLIFLKQKKALAELNRIVRILGINKSFDKTEEVIFKIEKKFNLGNFTKNKKDTNSEEDIESNSMGAEEFGFVFSIIALGLISVFAITFVFVNLLL